MSPAAKKRPRTRVQARSEQEFREWLALAERRVRERAERPPKRGDRFGPLC